jgi:hypothetical protein
MSDRRKDAAYWEGYRAEAARIAAREAARSGGHAADAEDVMRNLRHDEALKNRIFARSPSLLYAIDAEELGTMSATELATRELKELGITPKNSDPVELLDSHYAGREYARSGGRRGAGMDSSGELNIIEKYIDGKE